MKRSQYIMGLFVMLLVAACARVPQQASKEAFQEAQCQYDSGFQLFENKALMEAFPYFIQVAGKLEVLPEDMDSAAMQLTSQAYVQMAHVFKLYIEDNAEIDALKRALYYQRMVNDTSLTMHANLELADAFFCIMEHDSATYYLDRVKPYLDTVNGNLDNYFSAQRLVSDLYYDLHEFDSCFLVMHELIAFKTRHGIDTKNDSVNLGITMFHSPYCLQSKPYLLKALDCDIDDMKLGAVMSLLARIYELEGNADSVTFCQKYHASYVKAETDRDSDGLLAVKQYDNYKAERDARLTALREEKDARKAQNTRCIWIVVVVLVVLAAVWLFFTRRRHHLNALKDKDHEALQIKVQAVFSDRMNNKMERIRNEFNASYPDALAKLQAAYPELSETELDICLLSFFSFRLKEAADLLDLRENTVAKYRTTIKKKTQTDDLEGVLKPFLG